MMKSTHPLEHTLEMRYYGDSHPGIGGRLRSIPEDFIVEEIPGTFTGSGPYLICKLTRRLWEHQHAVQEIAKRLGISRRRIQWAGTKDRNAVATHYISLYNVSPEDINKISMKDCSIEPAGYHQFALSLGDLLGNRFRIRIRDCEQDNLVYVPAINDTIESGIPNYYGLQRFGAAKPITHLVGLHILRKEYREAVMTYIGVAFPQEAEEVQSARAAFKETGNAREALHALPVRLGFERAMLDYLVKNEEDYSGALKALPPKLLSMFVSGWQSYLFNAALSERFDRGLFLHEPEPGDTIIFANGRTDRATERNLGTAQQHIRRGRAMIAACLPGARAMPHPGPMERSMIQIQEKAGIGADAYQTASQYVKTAFEGAVRPIVMKTEIQSTIEESSVLLRFTLPPGQYATSVCREFMKGDPIHLI